MSLSSSDGHPLSECDSLKLFSDKIMSRLPTQGHKSNSHKPGSLRCTLGNEAAPSKRYNKLLGNKQEEWRRSHIPVSLVLTGFYKRKKGSKRVRRSPEKGPVFAVIAPKSPYNLEPFKLNDLQIEPIQSSILEAAVLLIAITVKVCRKEDKIHQLWEGRE